VRRILSIGRPHGIPLTLSVPATSYRTTADGAGRLVGAGEGGQRRVRKRALVSDGRGPMGEVEGEIRRHHERMWCCVWLAGHCLITHMAANIAKSGLSKLLDVDEPELELEAISGSLF
jgi:hypothetical protein